MATEADSFKTVLAETAPRIWPRIKICGLTSQRDAEMAIDAGADGLGFNLYQHSPRFIDISLAADWLGKLPAGIPKIAVLVNPRLAEAVDIARLPFIDALQLHGEEAPQLCTELARREICFAKALAVVDENSIAAVESFSTATILLDSWSNGFGGSGRPFRWEVAAAAVNKHDNIRVILAGGLKPENVAEAIRQVRPFGVDVTTGVERSPGRKDPKRICAFVQAARASLS